MRDVAIESGYDALASDRPEAFSSVYTNDIDVVVLDLMMPGTDGIEIIRFLAECGSNSSIILISGYNAGVECCFSKPVDIAKLLNVIGLQPIERKAESRSY